MAISECARSLRLASQLKSRRLNNWHLDYLPETSSRLQCDGEEHGVPTIERVPTFRTFASYRIVSVDYALKVG